jgi:CRISPR-associated exonuclease Cas4
MSGLNDIFLTLAAAAALIAAIVLLLARGLRRESGLPEGAILYADRGGTTTETLVSERYGLCGKPDYLLEGDDNDLIPVEVKSGNAPRNGEPYRSHLMQLAVYFVLVEDALDRPVHHGLIRYRDRTLRIENTDELLDDLFSVIQRMDEAAGRKAVRRNHEQAGRCAGCSMAHACNERLT